jgi:hypothetical protein
VPKLVQLRHKAGEEWRLIVEGDAIDTLDLAVIECIVNLWLSQSGPETPDWKDELPAIYHRKAIAIRLEHYPRHDGMLEGPQGEIRDGRATGEADESSGE